MRMPNLPSLRRYPTRCGTLSLVDASAVFLHHPWYWIRGAFRQAPPASLTPDGEFGTGVIARYATSENHLATSRCKKTSFFQPQWSETIAWEGMRS